MAGRWCMWRHTCLYVGVLCPRKISVRWCKSGHSFIFSVLLSQIVHILHREDIESSFVVRHEARTTSKTSGDHATTDCETYVIEPPLSFVKRSLSISDHSFQHSPALLDNYHPLKFDDKVTSDDYNHSGVPESGCWINS